jgi:hypothetical protein
MKNDISRRKMLISTATGAVVLAAGSSAAFAGCGQNHKKLGYRLGAIFVDPTLDEATRNQLLASANCPDCGIKIEPDGLSHGEHMRG